MPLTEQETDELELLRLKKRRLEIVGQQPLTAQQPSFKPRVEEEARPFDFPVGAAIGGTIGAIAGAPGLGTSLIGAGLGAGAGEAGEQLIRRGLGLPAPETSFEAGKEIIKEGALGVAGEAGGRVVVGAGGRALRFIKPRPVVSEEAARAIRFLDENLPFHERSRFNPLRYIVGKETKRKLTLLPAEATESRAMDILNNLSESSIIGGGGLATFKTNRTKALVNIADDIIDTFGARAEPDMVGELFLKATQGELKASRTGAEVIYNTVEDILRPAIARDPLTGITREVSRVNVPMKQAKEFIEPLLKEARKLKGLGGAEAGDDIALIIDSYGDFLDFSTAKELRSRLIAKADQFSVTNPKAKIIGRAKKLVGIIDDAMEKSLKIAGEDEALRLLREANRLWRTGDEAFNSAFIRRLIKLGEQQGNPEAIAKAILKDRAVSNVRRAKTAVGGMHTDSWQRLQSYFTQDIFERSTKRGTSELTGIGLEANLKRMGEQTLREIYTPGQLTKLRRFANVLKVTQAKQAEGTGRMFIQLSQAGAVLSVPFGEGMNRTAATILLAPGILAKAFTIPEVADILIHGFRAGAKTKIAAGAMGRFVTDVINLQFREQKEEAR